MKYIAVLRNSTESLQNRSTILPLFIGPHAVCVGMTLVWGPYRGAEYAEGLVRVRSRANML